LILPDYAIIISLIFADAAAAAMLFRCLRCLRYAADDKSAPSERISPLLLAPLICHHTMAYVFFFSPYVATQDER